MKKILLSLALVLFCADLSSYAAQGYVFSADDRAPVYMQSVQISNLPYGEYLRYYNINTEKIGAEFINLSKSEEKVFLKTLTKEEKENYNYVKKVQKIINDGDWNKVFIKYPNFLPAYLQYYELVYRKNDFNEALRILHKINSLDRQSQIFNPEIVNKSFGFLYFSTGQYTAALNYFKLYENNADDFIISSIANCYYALGNYTAAIDYSKRLKSPQYHDVELLYGAYYKLKNFPEANKYAKQLLNQNYSYDNLIRYQQTTQNENEKLVSCYKARNLAKDDTQLYAVNTIIAGIEQKRLEQKAAKVIKFVKIPKWADLEAQIPDNVSETEVTLKQDEFFNMANTYLNKYKEQDLTNAFNSLNQDFNKYIQDKKDEYYKYQQLEAQKALINEQRRSNMLQQQLIREQQIRNYMYLTRPYYYYYPRYYHYHYW